MADYEKELLADLQSSDEEGEEETNEVEEAQVGVDDEGVEANTSRRTFQEKLTDLIVSSSTTSSPFQTILQHPNIESVTELRSLSKIFPLIPELRGKLNEYSNDQENDFLQLLSEINDNSQGNFQSDEYRFIVAINELSTLINDEIQAYSMLLKVQYRLVFPELESIIVNNIDYARIVLIIKQDLTGIQKYEQDLKKLVTNDKVLVLIMSALQQSKDHFTLSEKDMAKLISCASFILELDEILHQLSKFISHKLAKFAPNVSAIVGPITTSQLLIACGSLQQLALTPSCNIASLGVRDLSSNNKTASRNVRQTGYVYHSDMVKFLPPEIQRSAMRIVSGKLILAARMDLAKSDLEGKIGTKLKKEIEVKIDKLLAPPEQTPNKALPAPVEIKSKKRGGRRLRKMKERFQMSELRKAQNKLEFGKQEETITDDYGEDIGLGMSRSGGGNGRLGQIQVNKNTSARMSKSMIERLQKSKQQQQQQQQQKQKQKEQGLANSVYEEDFDNIILGRAVPQSDESKPEPRRSRWLTGSMKRNIDVVLDGDRAGAADKKMKIEE
ncbi:uncharacterized protein LODBEIA_P25160 [Lodderomyces beijingensis]|uniref:Nop domain-containing protein n=1 Tax=Lodderomyces beijingensis TaxID=1775926 RepID=A0ABP0ZJH4_9ASCO